METRWVTLSREFSLQNCIPWLVYCVLNQCRLQSCCIAKSALRIKHYSIFIL